jgi:hypothetical protein
VAQAASASHPEPSTIPQKDRIPRSIREKDAGATSRRISTAPVSSKRRVGPGSTPRRAARCANEVRMSTSFLLFSRGSEMGFTTLWSRGGPRRPTDVLSPGSRLVGRADGARQNTRPVRRDGPENPEPGRPLIQRSLTPVSAQLQPSISVPWTHPLTVVQEPRQEGFARRRASTTAVGLTRRDHV